MPMKDLILSMMLEHLEEKTNPYAIGMAAAIKATGDEPPLEKSTIKKAHKIAKSIEKNEEVELDAAYLEIAQYTLDENIELDDLTEEQLDELLGSVLKGAAKLAYKGAKTALVNKKGNFRFSTAGRADAAQSQVQKIRKQQADRKRLEKARADLQKLRQNR
jgi:hypothetical protein